MQFWPPDDEHMCSKHVEAWKKIIVKQILCIKVVKYRDARSAKRKKMRNNGSIIAALTYFPSFKCPQRPESIQPLLRRAGGFSPSPPAPAGKAPGSWTLTCIVCRGYECVELNLYRGARGGAVGWGTAPQAGRSRVRFPMVSLEFFIDTILPAALWRWSWLSL